MSMFEPGAEPDHHSSSDQPQFRVVVRGYDRQEVAAYIQDLWSHIENERQRAEQAERTIAQMQVESSATKSRTPTFEHLGVEAAKVLEQAGHSAELLVEEAQGRSRSILEEAQAQAAELVATAERRAEEMRSSAAEDARRTLEEAHEAADRIRREVQEEGVEARARTERMQSLHDSLLEHLGRVRHDLSALLGLPDDRPADEADEPVAAGRAEPTERAAGETSAGPAEQTVEMTQQAAGPAEETVELADQPAARSAAGAGETEPNAERKGDGAKDSRSAQSAAGRRR